MEEIRIRTLNEFEPRDDDGRREPRPEQPGASAFQPGETPEDYSRRQRDLIAGALEVFEEIVTTKIRNARAEMRTLRTSDGIDARYRIEDAKFRSEEKPELLADGSIDLSGPHAHLKAGLTLGLFTDNCTVIPPILNETLVNRGELPVAIEPVGSKKENDLKSKVFEDLLGKMLDSSHWRAEMESALRDLPRHGTAALRQSWAEEVEMVQDQDGRWIEQVRRKGLAIRHWPLLDLYVSNPERPWAWEQDGIIWQSTTTLSALAVNERVFDTGQTLSFNNDEDPMMVPLVALRGRYVNLDQLRAAESQLVREDYEAQTTGGMMDSQAENAGTGQVSAEKVYDLYEFQGYFPVGSMLRAGLLTQEMLAYYGVELQGANGPLSGEAAARLADRLIWYVSIVGESNDGRHHVIEFRPCPYRRPRNELLHGVFIPDGQKFYGLSSDAIAHDVGDAADKVLNDIVDILDNNANPTRVYNRSAFEDDEKAEKALTMLGATVGVAGGINAAEAVQYLVKPYDASFGDIMNRLIEIYTTRTMATQSMKGAKAVTESNTLGEIKEQLSASEKRLGDIIFRLAEVSLITRSARLAIEDLCWFYTPQELDDEAARVCGELGVRARSMFPTAEDKDGRARPLADELIIRHAGNAKIQKEVATQFLMQIAQTFADLPGLKRVECLRQAVSLMGFDPESYFADDEGPTSPRKELTAILSGDTPAVDPREDALGVHLPAHQFQMQMLQAMRGQAEATGGDTSFWDGAIEVLNEHILDTQDLAQQQMAAIQQAMALQAQTAAAPSHGRKGGKNPGAGAPPPDQNQIAAGLQGAASGPQPAMGGAQ